MNVHVCNPINLVDTQHLRTTDMYWFTPVVYTSSLRRGVIVPVDEVFHLVISYHKKPAGKAAESRGSD